MAFIVIYVPQVILLAWALHEAISPGQSESVITAYLSVCVGLISSLIATATFHSSAAERKRAEKENAPLLLLVGKAFDSSSKGNSNGPQFEWQQKPTIIPGLVEYGILNKGAAVIVTKVEHAARKFREREIKWKTYSMGSTTQIRQLYHGRHTTAVPIPSSSVYSNTPFFDMWMNLSTEFGQVVTIHFIEPTSKRLSQISFMPEQLPVASRNAFKEQDED